MRGLLAVLLLVIVSSAGAASLGRLAVLSAIGEPLRAEIEVSVSPEELETAIARFAPADAYAPAGLQYDPLLNGARAAIRYRHNGRYVVDLVTTRPVNEPVLSLLVELEVRGARLMRVYNVLLGPQPEGATRAAPAAVIAPVAIALATPAVAAPVVKVAPKSVAAPGASRPAAPAQAAAAGSPELDRELQRLEAQLNAHAKTLIGMLDRVAVMEREVAQLQKAFAALDSAAAAPQPATGSPAAVPPVSAVAATAPAVAEPQKPAVTVTPPKQVREAPASVPPLVRPRSWTDTLFDNALLVMAGMLLVMVVGLVYWTWGRRPASDAAKAPPAEA